MSGNGEVLVAILNKQQDFAIAKSQCWYRIPVSSAHKWIGERWPPRWIAFYHTKALEPLSHGVFFYAEVKAIRKAYRWQLFPDEPRDNKSNRQYYQILFEPWRQLPKPILSRRWRRIVFIPTTWHKFINAVEINDLYDESPLEDRLWAEFRRLHIQAERQEFVRAKEQDYALDFAIYCESGSLDIETDGDTWHANPEKAASDNLRNNALTSMGWTVLRFSTPQIQERLAEDCVPKILKTINRLDGINEGRIVSRKFDLGNMGNIPQPGLFDTPADED